MPITSVQDWLQFVEKSDLLSPGQLAEVRTWPEQEPATLAARMVNAGWITKWQSQRLLSGKGPFYFGRYKLLDLIGEGGMGAVYKAVQPSIGRTVALKVMNKQVLKQPKSKSRFLREIRSAAAVDDPHIVRAIDADRDGETYFLVMEYVTGRNLKSWIALEHALPVGWSCECIRQAALGLQHAFEQGMVHRDIKPSNLLVTQGEDDGLPLVKILDLGLARFVSETQEEGELTRSGQVLGTPDYIAPEQARNTRTADIRADIFSLGCALFELLTGRLPFPGENVMEKLMARASQDAPPVRMYRPEVPAELDGVVARMLARDPQYRYGTPAEVAQALAPFAIGTARAAAAQGSANFAQVGVQTPSSSRDTANAAEVSTEGLLNGFPAELSYATPVRVSRSAQRSTDFWQQPRIRIAGGIVAGIALLGLIGSLLPREKKSPAAATDNTPPPQKKHKLKAAEDTREPVETAETENDPERLAARWVLEKGGTVTIVSASRKNGTSVRDHSGRHKVDKPGNLPAGPIPIVEAALPDDLHLDRADFERLAALRHVEGLSLAETHFAERDLYELRQLESLTRLDLQNTVTTDAGIRNLQPLRHLESLNLSGTRVSGPIFDVLRSMKDLTDLSLGGTQVSDGDLRQLGVMPQLVALNLAGSRVRGPGLTHLKRLKELSRLDLGSLPMQNNGMSHLRGLLKLRYLRLSGSRVTDGDLVVLSGMTNLHELLLGSTGVSGAGLKNLTWMAELEILDLQDTVVGDDGCKALQELSSLRSLNLRGSVVSDAGIEHLRSLSSLESVDLSGTKATRQGVESLQQALPKCKIEF
jgi:serine/threonine protein kinase